MSKWRLTARGGAMVRYSNFRSFAARGAADAAESSGTRRGRIGAAIIAAFLCLGLLFPALLVKPERSVSAAPASLPAPLRVISRGVPAYSSSSRESPASRANDNDYKTYWRSNGVPAWLAYNLSGVPGPQRGNVILAWYNDPITPDYNYNLTKSLPYNL